jgi:hypothetical protein
MQSSDTLQSRKKRWHFSVEKDFVCDSRLSPMARMLYLVLTSYASPTSPVPFPGMRTLSTILQCTEDTIRKYRVELERNNWLEVERRRDGLNKWLNNAYILLDGPDDPGAMPKKPDMAFSGHGKNPSRVKPGVKSTQVLKEETSEAKSNQQEQYRASGDGAAGGGDSTPSAISGPRSSAEKFIQEYKTWGRAARISATVVPAERTALQEFFADNEITPAELTAIMLAAWLMDSTAITPGTENHQAYWHCRVKSRRIKTFIQFLPNIQDELEWKGQPQAEKIMRIAQQRFLQQKAA